MDPILSKAIFSGQILDDQQDIGYGPAQYLAVDQVKNLSEVLDRTGDDEIRQGYDPVNMTSAEVYLSPWQNSKDDLNALMKYYYKLREFYMIAAKQEQAVITYIE